MAFIQWKRIALKIMEGFLNLHLSAQYHNLFRPAVKSLNKHDKQFLADSCGPLVLNKSKAISN